MATRVSPTQAVGGRVAPCDPSRGGAAMTLVAAAGVGAGAGDNVAGRRQGEPSAAERGDALAVRVAGLLVTHVEVERVAVVGDLLRTVRAHGRADLGSGQAGADCRLTRVGQRR